MYNRRGHPVSIEHRRLGEGPLQADVVVSVVGHNLGGSQQSP